MAQLALNKLPILQMDYAYDDMALRMFSSTWPQGRLQQLRMEVSNWLFEQELN